MDLRVQAGSINGRTMDFQNLAKNEKMGPRLDVSMRQIVNYQSIANLQIKVDSDFPPSKNAPTATPYPKEPRLPNPRRASPFSLLNLPQATRPDPNNRTKKLMTGSNSYSQTRLSHQPLRLLPSLNLLRQWRRK